MQASQEAVIVTLRRVQGFLDTHAAALGAAITPNARKSLDDALAVLAGDGIAQDGSTRGGRGETANQRKLRLVLRNQFMRPIAVVARQNLSDVPQFEDLCMPPWSTRGENLFAKAGGMAEAAEAHTQVFVDAGLSPDFLANLRGAANALHDSVVARNSHVARRVRSTSGLVEQEKHGRAVLRILNSVVTAALDRTDPLLFEWRSVAHIAKRATSASTPAASEPSQPATPGTPVTQQAA